MWRGARRWVGRAIGGAFLVLTILALVGGASASSPGRTGVSPLPSTTSACPAHYSPIADCAVPNGGSFDPCSAVTAGKISCSFNLPDLNPADWLAWFGCAVLADAQAIFNAILNLLNAFILTLVNSVLSLISASLQTVLDAISGAINSVILTFQTILLSITSSIASSAQGFGPLAPVIVILLTAGLFLVAIVGFYVLAIGMIAIGKTLFNLL